jgi:hypothetical protein
VIKRDPKDDTDPNAPTTYFEVANAGIALEGGGRFAAQSAVVGSTPTPAELYPATSVPNADVGVEPPLDDLHPEPVGTPAEVAASIAEREAE